MDILKGIVAYLLVPLVGTAIVYRHARRDCDKWIKLLFVYAIEAVATRICAGWLVLRMMKELGSTYTDGSGKYVFSALVTSLVLSYAYVLLRKAYTVRLTTDEKNADDKKA